jgi:hypothetical protein
MSENDESTVIAENSDISLNCGDGNKVLIHPLPPIRKKKILEIRRQLSKDGYNIDKRLDAVLDRLLENLVA